MLLRAKRRGGAEGAGAERSESFLYMGFAFSGITPLLSTFRKNGSGEESFIFGC